MFGNLKKKIALSIVGGFIPIMIIFLCLMVLIASTSTENKSIEDEMNIGSSMEIFVSIAEQECINVAGKKGGDKYRQWYTGSADGANWCATFISWCANEAGILDIAIPKFQSCDAGIEWFKLQGVFEYTNAYNGNAKNCKRGDIIFFSKGDKNDSTHVGIVTGFNDGIINTVEGNSSNTIKNKTYDIANNNKKILGFASPIFPDFGSSSAKGSLSEAFKFFAIYESGGDYSKGFSKGDGYHALGYYQFDNRYDLQEFLKYCFNSDNSKYKIFKKFLAMSKSKLANNKELENAWKQVYINDPEDFASKQDTFEYNNYYIPVENALNKKAIYVANRQDAVKGMCCSLSNWAGSKTASKIIKDAKVNNNMNDITFVSTVYDYLYSLKYEDYKKYGKTGKKYYAGWKNRWKREKNTCISYLN